MSKNTPFILGLTFLVGVLLGIWIGESTTRDTGIAEHSDLYELQPEQGVAESAYNKEIKRIFIHCTATTADWSAARLKRFFKESRGWSKYGYHYYIRKDGSVHVLTPMNSDSIITWDEVAYGARGYNATSIHIAYAGGVDNQGNATDTRTPAQITAIHTLVDSLRNKYGCLPVFGHRFVANKGCPSFDTVKEFGDSEFREQIILQDSLEVQ